MKAFLNFSALFLLITYCNMPAQMTLKYYTSGGKTISGILDKSTGTYPYLFSFDPVNHTAVIVDAAKFSTAVTITEPDLYSINEAINDFNKNGSNEVIVNFMDQTTKRKSVKIIEIGTKEVVKEWTDAVTSYTAYTVVSGDNRQLLIVEGEDNDPTSHSVLVYDLGITATNPSGIPTAGNSAKPADYSLQQNFPNPFNPSTTIEYTVAEAGKSVINIYDINGRLIKTLEKNNSAPGTYTIQWNGLNSKGEKMPSGMYVYRLESGSYNESKKMIMLK